ncbi:hypothetical protein QEZ40_005047 [Streptomyces katrae]|uniref:Uncharacterized protein n=1 Tax=Streptomyces katrae TaxID=68223 RepID=A0ABT7H3I5_9ACTN|nr:hypothetical protein [Streptomyces katrae]MDK9499620.1 hypothetical protein [Streptomyces katrae]
MRSGLHTRSRSSWATRAAGGGRPTPTLPRARLLPKPSASSGCTGKPFAPAGHQGGRSGTGRGSRSGPSATGAGPPVRSEPRNSGTNTLAMAPVWSLQSQYGTVTPGTSA